MKYIEEIDTTQEELKNIRITINWGYLVSGKGLRRVENVFQVILGKVLFWFILIVNIGIIVSELRRGYLLKRIYDTEGISAFIFWIFSLVFLYALYLLRDRGTFLDKARKQNLHIVEQNLKDGSQISKIEITDYMNHNLLWVVDYVLNISHKNYLEELLKKLLKLQKARGIIERLGLELEDLDFGVLSTLSDADTKTQIMRDLLHESFTFAYTNGFKYVGEDAFMFVFIRKFYAKYLERFNILIKDFEGIRVWLSNEALKQRYVERWKQRISIKPKSTVNRAYTSRFTPTLNQYARDFTTGVIQGDFKLSIAREGELAKMITVLEKGEKSAVLLVGEPGVGKTTLLKSLAVRMVVEEVPPKLQDQRLVAFDFNKAFTSTKDIDSFKKMLRDVFEEVSRSGNVILVLDNINQLLNLRQEISGEIVNVIVDSYDSSNMRLIATTDRSQFVRFIRPHKALTGMFTQVEMDIPSDEVAVQIVMDEVGRIEGEYGVKIAYSAIKASVELSHKFSHDRVLPDKAIDILKETVVNFKHLAGQKPLEYDEVAKVISSKVGVKLGSISDDEAIKLTRLEEEMHKRVIDQNEAVNAVSGALRRSRSGISEEGRPIASFLFFGPTGVGKTEVAKTVADVYYGSEDRMVRIDMSEYHEADNLKRLIGFTSPKGSFEGGFLTEPVHKDPFSMVLLDELDKANPKVLDLFLQVLDEGYLDDGLGRRVDFSNSIIIATSNAGSSVIANLIERGKNYKEVSKRALEELKKVFRIELLNRFDKIIMFKPLNPEEIKLVARKFVEQVSLKLSDKGIKLTYGDELLAKLARLGYNPIFGAREMRRVVQEEVENKVADMIVRGEVRAGGEVRL